MKSAYRGMILMGLFAFAACATGGSGSAAAGEYALEMRGPAGAWSGQVVLGGDSEGTFSLSDPITINAAPARYSARDGAFQLTAEYRVVESGCSGVIELDGLGDEGGFVGSVTIEDDCVGQLDAEFTLRGPG